MGRTKGMGESQVAVKDNILLKLREMRGTLTPVEQRIADYVLENTGEIPGLSIRELAFRSRTSDASVLRFCRTMGYAGYRQFIVGISTSLGSMGGETAEQYTDIQPGDDLETIIHNVSLNNRRSIEDTMRVIDSHEIARAVQAIRKAQKVEFFGIGASGLVCMDAEQKFMRIDKSCRAYTDGHAQLTAAALLRRGDVAVLFSNSGDTAEILDTLAVARKSGATRIAVTRYQRSPLAEGSDIRLFISTPEITIRSGAMGSRIAMLNIVDILFSGVASAEYAKIKRYLSKTHNVLLHKHRP